MNEKLNPIELSRNQIALMKRMAKVTIEDYNWFLGFTHALVMTNQISGDEASILNSEARKLVEEK